MSKSDAHKSKVYLINQFCFIRSDSSCWQSVTTYNHFQPPINVKSMLLSPKELFIEKIFKKGKFSSQTIAKAISVSFFILIYANLNGN